MKSSGTFSWVVIGMAAAAAMMIAKNAMLNLVKCVILFVGFSEKGRLLPQWEWRRAWAAKINSVPGQLVAKTVSYFCKNSNLSLTTTKTNVGTEEGQQGGARRKKKEAGGEMFALIAQLFRSASPQLFSSGGTLFPASPRLDLASNYTRPRP